MPIVLGIDPGTRKAGFGVVGTHPDGRIYTLEYGLYHIPKVTDMNQQLYALFEQTQAIMRRHHVTHAAIELAFHNQRFAAGGFVTREAIGALRMATLLLGCPITTYNPQQIKKAVTGNGDADKLEVIHAVMGHLDLSHFTFSRILRGKTVQETRTPEELVAKDQDHLADALAIGICRLHELTQPETTQEEAS